MAQITFLGTGGDAYVVGKAIRGAGGIVIRIAGNQFLLDPGPGCLRAAKDAAIQLRESVGVLVSHGHLNHAGDVNAALSAITYGGLDTHGVLLAADSVINGVDGISPSVSTFHARCAERAISLDGVPRVGINKVDVRITPALHDDPSAVGFQLIAGNERISYTGDTGLSEEVVEGHRGATVLIANMPLADDQSSAHQLNVSDVIALANGVDPKLLIVTHFGQQLLKQDVLAAGRQISQGCGCHVLVAEDGLEINTATYR